MNQKLTKKQELVKAALPYLLKNLDDLGSDMFADIMDLLNKTGAGIITKKQLLKLKKQYNDDECEEFTFSEFIEEWGIWGYDD